MKDLTNQCNAMATSFMRKYLRSIMSGSPLDSFSLITSTTPLEQIFRTTTVCLDESSPEVRDLHKVIPEGAKISIYVLDTECRNCNNPLVPNKHVGLRPSIYAPCSECLVRQAKAASQRGAGNQCKLLPSHSICPGHLLCIPSPDMGCGGSLAL